MTSKSDALFTPDENHHPEPPVQPGHESLRGTSRRKFIGGVGGAAAAAWTAGAIGAAPLLGSKGTKAEAATSFGHQRASQAYATRNAASTAEYQVPLVQHTSNGDETRFANKIGNFSKGLPHNSIGEVDLTAYGTLTAAITSGLPSDFENITLGGNVKLVNPQCGLAFDMEGTDSGQLFEKNSPSVVSQERADEAVENYWMALTRDINFTDYATDSTVAAACAELSTLGGFTGPKIGGQVTPQTLFRGFTAADVIGPYVSQFLLQPVNLGALPITQQYQTYVAGVDYMTDATSWLAVQNGQGPFASNEKDATLRYLRNGRDNAAWVHVDALFQAYFMGLLYMLTNKTGFNVGNPYNTSNTQAGFGTFGGPHIIALVAEVSTRALKAQWFQKWWVHRALRPEAFGGLVHYSKTGQANYHLHKDVLNSTAVANIFSQYGTYFLPIAFPEGCPQHPSYGSGHATVAGACVTILKAFFATDGVVFPSPVVPSSDGLSLDPYTGSDAGQMTLTGELNKLASNIAQARNIAGVHWRSDATQSMLLGEALAISILSDQRACYNETFNGFTFTKFDGTQVTV
jgi:hypothetical protein